MSSASPGSSSTSRRRRRSRAHRLSVWIGGDTELARAAIRGASPRRCTSNRLIARSRWPHARAQRDTSAGGGRFRRDPAFVDPLDRQGRGPVVLPVAEVLPHEEQAERRHATQSSCARAVRARSTVRRIRRARRRGRRGRVPRRRRTRPRCMSPSTREKSAARTPETLPFTRYVAAGSIAARV